ncbi:MAG TPA: hypothetical protein PKD37_01650 [Oligoflexia bacterium]|nr:hypothetical protein [Oligoflexia bacterium]HMP26681.1 hypothetical protein [Oligoflexia bacterium]
MAINEYNPNITAQTQLNLICLFIFICSLLTACPRGESQSVEQVLKTQQERFVATLSKRSEQLSAESKKYLLELAALNESFQKNKDFLDQKMAQNCSMLLKKLIPLASYTSRPAMTQIASQLSTYSQKNHFSSKDSDSSQASASGTLLFARALQVINSELETFAFGNS